MECREVIPKLDEYIMGRLDDGITDKIALHIKNCQRCSDEFATLKELNSILSIEKQVYPQINLTECVMNRVEDERVNAKKFYFNKSPFINLGISFVLTGMLLIFISIPSVNTTITKYTGDIVSSAVSINSDLGIKTNEIQTYIKKIMNPRGGIK